MAGIDEANELVQTSGNTFHWRVVSYFREIGWETQISPYYLDASTNKAREIDLVVEKTWAYNDPYSAGIGTVHIKLFVECKYIPQTNVFWLDQKDIDATKEWLETYTPLTSDNKYTNDHHYISSGTKVAKLFASKNNPNTENETIYKALNQSLSAMVHLRNQGSIIPDPLGRMNILASIELPVILCNDFSKFFKIDGEEQAGQIEDNFQLEINYAYIDGNRNSRSEFFQIDVVSFDLIEQYLQSLEKDIEAIIKVL